MSWALVHPQHDVMNDGTDLVVLDPRDRYLNWRILRAVGALPFFEISYAALAISLTTVTAIGHLNHTRFIEAWTYPVPIPPRMMALLISSFFLAVGTTLYRIACPTWIQEYSEAKWVAELGHFRLLYLTQSIQRRGQLSTAFFSGFGGVVGLGLLIERVWAAFWYILEEIQAAGVMG